MLHSVGNAGIADRPHVLVSYPLALTPLEVPVITTLGLLANEGAVLAVLGVELSIQAALQQLSE